MPTQAEPTQLPTETEATELTREVERRLSGEQSSEVFRQAVQQMDDAAVQLYQKTDPGLDTQRIQQSVIDKLDQVIAAARQQQSQGGNNDEQQQQQSGNQQNQSNSEGQAQSSAQSSDPNEGEFSPGSVGQVAPDSRTLEEFREEWGKLPPRLRSELMEGLQEHFSPLYRSMTEAYYQRLAEEQE